MVNVRAWRSLPWGDEERWKKEDEYEEGKRRRERRRRRRRRSYNYYLHYENWKAGDDQSQRGVKGEGWTLLLCVVIVLSVHYGSSKK